MAAIQGYFWETPEEVWRFAREQGPKIVGRPLPQAHRYIAGFTKSQPCATTPFLTAMEVLSKNPILTPPSEKQFIPLVGTLQATERADIEKEVEELIAQGYGVIKIKVGFHVEKDAAKARIAQEAVQERALIRLDANLGYTLPQAQKLVQNINPRGIEFLEQPFKENEWEAMVDLARTSPVPLGLDESIYAMEAVEKAGWLQCARFVKFKIMKMGSGEGLARAIEAAQKYGLKVILGNGAAGEISCYHESLVAGKMISRAGEMNGFLKQKESILAEGLETQGGKIIVEPGFSLKLDRQKIDRFAIDRLSFGCKTRSCIAGFLRLPKMPPAHAQTRQRRM